MKLSADSWSQITDSNPDVFSSKKYLYLKTLVVGKKSINLCKEVSTNLYGVMFIANRTQSEEKELPATKGFEVRFDFYNSLTVDEVAVIIKLAANDFLDAFVYLIEDIFSGFEKLSSEKEIVDYFFNRLNIWKTFFDRVKEKGMSDAYRRGLFAELYFIKKYLVPKFGPKSTKFWSGPQAGIHDFEFGKLAVEVKSSAGNKSTVVRISNERQLENEGYENLLLFHVSLSVRKNHHPTLVDLISEVGTFLAEDYGRMLEFHNLLLMYGYHPMHEEFYINDGYHVDEENFYRVVDGFPRIIGEQIPDGVGGIKYSIDMSACTSFKLDPMISFEILDSVVVSE